MNNDVHWLNTVFFPAIAYRMKSKMFKDETEPFIIKNRIVLVKRRLMIKHNVIEFNRKNGIASSFSLGIGTGVKSSPLTSYSLMSLDAGPYVVDVGFNAFTPSTKWDKFLYDFHAKAQALEKTKACIVELDIPIKAISEIKRQIEERNEMQLTVGNIELLRPNETLEEVLIERDLTI